MLLLSQCPAARYLSSPTQTGVLTLLSVCLLLLAESPVAMVSAQMDQVESLPIDGQQFREGQKFRFTCMAIGNPEFAVRLLCPLAGYGAGSTACFENCGRPLCDQPTLNDCRTTVPELLNTNCSRSIRQISPTVYSIHLEYTFYSVSTRHDGSYSCQFKTMRSGVYIIVTATTTAMTTTSPSTTASTSTPTTSTTASTTSDIASTTSTTASTTSTTASTTSTTASTTSTTASTTSTTASTTPTTLTHSSMANSSLSTAVGGMTTTTVAKTSRLSPSVGVTTVSKSSNTEKSSVTTPEQLLTQPSKTSATTQRSVSEATEIPLKSGWFYGSIVGTMSAVDIILICVLAFILTTWLIGFLCVRCQVAYSRHASSCCSIVLCLGSASQQPGRQQLIRKQRQQQRDHTNGGLRKFAEEERQRGGIQLTAMRTAVSADVLSAGPVYSEAVDGSYYSPEGEFDLGGDGGDANGSGHRQLLLAGAGSDDYYHLQQEFDDPLAAHGVGGGGGGGFSTNPRSTFVPRDQTGRHSFQSARPAARQRPGIPRELLETPEDPPLLPPSGSQQNEVMTRDEFKRRMNDQKREIANLRQQLRDSQLQLSQLAATNSQRDLRPSVTSGFDTRPRQPLPPTAAANSSDYEVLARASANVPPSPPPPPPPPPQPLTPSVSRPTPLDDADLPPPPPPLPPPPMSEVPAVFEAADDSVFRRNSLDQAYQTGQRY